MSNTRRALALILCLLMLPLRAPASQGPVYEVFVASFADGDGDQRGDLKGLTQKLDYISALGVGSIWMMPISPSPSYHKYDVMDYMAIDPAYGSLDDFGALLQAADERGIRILLDLVLNHSSNLHPWFLSAIQELKEGKTDGTADYYLFSQVSGHPVPGLSGWFYQGNFGPHMPDLNLDSPALRKEIQTILAFWLNLGVGGFRLDATTHYYEDNTAKNTAFLRWLKDETKAIKPDSYLVAEAWKDESTILALYESGIDSLFNFPLSNADGALVKAIRAKSGLSLAQRVARYQARLLERNPLGKDAPFLSNHDNARSAGFLMHKDQQTKLAAALYLTMPGIPYIYYGEELGMSGSGRDENKRLPMLWDMDDSKNTLPPAEADQAQRLKISAAMQEEDPASLLHFYRRLGTLRKARPAFEQGQAKAMDLGDTRLSAWSFEGSAKELTVVHNLSAEQIIIPWHHGGSLQGWDTGMGAPTLANDSLTLPPYSGCIID